MRIPESVVRPLFGLSRKAQRLNNKLLGAARREPRGLRFFLSVCVGEQFSFRPPLRGTAATTHGKK